MSIAITYKPLFKLHLFHNFFLGIGEDDYDHKQVPDAFNAYDFQRFATIIPTAKTAKLLKNHKILIQQTSTGVAGLISVDEDLFPFIDNQELELDFLVYIKDRLFEKYTDINKDEAQIHLFKTTSNQEEQSSSVEHTENENGNENAKGKVNKNAKGKGNGNDNGNGNDDGDGTGDELTNNEDHSLDQLASNSFTPINDYAVEYDIDQDSLYQKLLLSIGSYGNSLPFGVVKIEVKNLLDSSGKVDSQEKEFKIMFQSKKTTWVYYDSKDIEVHRTNTTLPFVQKGTIDIIDDNAKVYRMATPNDTIEAGETKIYV